jgi:hypothetical protein
MDDSFDDEEQEDFGNRHKRVHEMPIMLKAREILKITKILTETLEGNKNELPVRDLMLEDAMMVPVKISGAEAAGLYTLRMENAVIIKIHARSLLTFTVSLKMDNPKSHDYINLLRTEIEEFKELFKDWVAGFDKSDDIPDDWGLFY